MTTTTTKHLEVWHDEKSDPFSPVWCVSICWESGDEYECLSSHTTRSAAVRAAKKASKLTGLEIRNS